MIHTVTFNPAVDYVVQLDPFVPGAVNRTAEESLHYGGKGINVSTVLTRLGISNIALGFLAGFTGEAIETALRAEGIHTDFIWLEKGFSRINIKLNHGAETEINGQGPTIPPKALEALFQKTDDLSKGDVLVLAGSIPTALPTNLYARILERLEGKGVDCVVDATGVLLLDTLKHRPFLLKPNRQELGVLFGKNLQTAEELEYYAKKLQEMGARNVLVSRGEKGALLAAEDGRTYQIGVVSGNVQSTVGAGDAMVAGFLAGWLERHSYTHALRLGTAAGCATAFTNGVATGAEILEVFQKLSF